MFLIISPSPSASAALLFVRFDEAHYFILEQWQDFGIVNDFLLYDGIVGILASSLEEKSTKQKLF